MPSTIAITAADEAFMPLLKGLLLSLQTLRGSQLAKIAVFDLGLSKESQAWIRVHADLMEIPGWDLPLPNEQCLRKPHLRSLTCRPFLPRYFPGFDTYIWLDADTWLQSAFAIDWLIAASQGGALAAVPELDRSYRPQPKAAAWRRQRLNACFGPNSLHLLDEQIYVNAGVFALSATAPHWSAWARHFRHALEFNGGEVVSDQTALNFALWKDKLPLHPLPALCNWTLHLGLPSWDRQRRCFVEPFIPQREIGILHMTGEASELRLKIPDEAGITSFANPASPLEETCHEA